MERLPPDQQLTLELLGDYITIDTARYLIEQDFGIQLQQVKPQHWAWQSPDKTIHIQVETPRDRLNDKRAPVVLWYLDDYVTLLEDCVNHREFRHHLDQAWQYRVRLAEEE